jgi:hypothetical protein
MQPTTHDNLHREWVHRNNGKLVLCGAGLVLAIGVLWLGSAVTADGAAGTAAEVATAKQELTADLELAETSLTRAHEELLASLPEADVERVKADTAQARSVVLTIANSSASPAELAEQQSRLDKRFTFWNHRSQALTTFLPAWLENTGPPGQRGTPGTTFQLTWIEVHPVRGAVRVAGPDYGYVGVARLDPIESSATTGKKAEFLVFTITTGHDEGITGFEVYQASAATRDAYLAAEKTDSRTQPRGRELDTETTESRRRER